MSTNDSGSPISQAELIELLYNLVEFLTHCTPKLEGRMNLAKLVGAFAKASMPERDGGEPKRCRIRVVLAIAGALGATLATNKPYCPTCGKELRDNEHKN